ncbi:toll-like receptor Tollo [Pecten maximus]|uniref:toll-like receptor Tollo n=1 Tax=Pecten maximus TaxID=6579 RepID=UPI0014590E94|nr:toll-like receptor Tollo [Pecten maximus]
MRDFVEFFRHENNLTIDGAIIQYNYLLDLECQKPEVLKGRKIVGVTINELGCDLETTTLLAAPIIILCFIVVFLIVFIIIMIKYRKEIVILAFTRLNILLPCQMVEDNAGKKFDAFVSYSQHDSNWVLKTLVPGLERPNGLDPFRLCLHQRDFAVGTAIAENIVNSVEASRHTILVISRKFLESEWCLMEFRTAFHQSLLEKKKHLILVTVEQLAPEELDADLKRCMQTLTYVHINDRLFWDKIIFSLSDKRKRNRDNRFFNNLKRYFLRDHKQQQQQQQQQRENDNNNEAK